MLDVVNLRLGDAEGPQPGSIAEAFGTLVDLQQQGLIRHLGVSNVTPEQVAEARAIAPIVCVQNMYNLANRHDDELIDTLAATASPTCRSSRSAGSARCSRRRSRRSPPGWRRTPMAVALAWLLQRSPNILLIPGTSSVAHLRENIAGARLALTDEDVADLDPIGRTEARCSTGSTPH